MRCPAQSLDLMSNTPPAGVTITQQAATARIAIVATRDDARHEPHMDCQNAATNSSAAGIPNHHSNHPTNHMTTGSMR